MERRLAAILAADVVGYSKLMGQDEASTLATLRELRRGLLAPMLEEYRGNLIKSMGDGWLVEFPSSGDAFACAMRMQEALEEHKTIKLRIGLHIGDVTFEDEDIYGDGVNIAARLQDLAAPGSIILSDFARRSIDGKLASTLIDFGPRMFKNIAEPIHCYGWGKVATASDENSRASLPDKPSIAVLPFDNMSGDPEQEYFSDGISEDIITALSRFRSFQVTARNSTFSYKGQSIAVQKVGEELGVRYVLQGSVRKSGNRVRITAQLIDAQSGNHLWADRFDRELVDIFILQDEITESIVGTIEQQVGSIERSRALQKRTEDLKSWDLFQRGMFHVWQMTGDSLEAGVALLRQSIDSDRTFAEAHAWLSFTFLHQVYLNTVDDLTETIAAALRHTQQAIKYDEHLALGHEMLARILIFERRYDEAVAAAERAVQLNPNSTSANFSLAVVLVFADRFEEALEPTRRAMKLSPKDHRRANHLNSLGIILSETGRLAEGIEALQEAVTLQHEDYRSALWLARYAAEAGQMDEARRAAAIVMKLNPEFSLNRLPATFGTTFTPAYLERFMPHIDQLGFPE